MDSFTHQLVNHDHYPILARKVGRQQDRRLVYLDSAATTLTSKVVTDAYASFLHTHCANIHRGAHQLAEEATDAYEHTREELASFFKAESPEYVTITHGATEALNLAALGWAQHELQPGDLIVISEDNHHSNIVPWLTVAKRTGADIAWIPLKPNGLLDYEAWLTLLKRRPRLVALCQQSNVIGFHQPSLEAIVEDALRIGTYIVMDGAQGASYTPSSSARLHADFYACSSHKMGGLTGVGALICSKRAAKAIHPVYGGGGMAAAVNRSDWEAMEGPMALEAGTPPIAAAVAWTMALENLKELEPIKLSEHCSWLSQYTRTGLIALENVSIVGGSVPINFNSLISFTVKGIHPHDISQALSDKGIMVRAGHHCARPLHKALGLKATVRASFGAYSTKDDADALLLALSDLIDHKETLDYGHSNR